MSEGPAYSQIQACVLSAFAGIALGTLFGVLALLLNGRQSGAPELQTAVSIWAAALMIAVWNYQQLRRQRANCRRFEHWLKLALRLSASVTLFVVAIAAWAMLVNAVIRPPYELEVSHILLGAMSLAASIASIFAAMGILLHRASALLAFGGALGIGLAIWFFLVLNAAVHSS